MTSHVTSGTKKFVVSVVNSNTQTLERGFLVFGKSESPRITQKFVIHIAAGNEAVKKNIPIRNPYGLPKTFRITTSHPDIVKISEPLMSIPAIRKLPSEMYFVKTSHLQKTIETLLYISDAETYVQEEAYALTLIFEAS
ncbi:unnamed protein product [Caenorhabditis sp. 36 PRJEB53466]|nr:unnamed protein product [Caenorhabditis sp. 36 PRJEB53466]